MSAAAGGSSRIESLDQFRGYTVAGMFVVNFLGGLAAIHPIFKHNNSFFSYADTIMPSFLFACGCSYRLTYLRRRESLGPGGAARMVIRRSLALVLVSLVLYGFDQSFKSWEQMTTEGIREFVAKLFKANLWEVLAIIGASQILTLPVIGRSAGARVLAIAGLIAAHFGLSYAFNYEFVHGRPNALDALWGAAKARSWDGGPFGLLMWSVPLLAGSLAFDAWKAGGPGRAWYRLAGWGLVLMGLGYGLSCLTRLYDPTPSGSTTAAPAATAEAASPVWPPLENAKGREWTDLLAEPPFVAPPPERPANYWRMDKRIVSPSFILFATGFALAAYAAFVIACDLGGARVGIFGVLGRNPLAAYVIHRSVEHLVLEVVPKDAPLWWCLTGLAAFLWITYAFVRYLDRTGVVIRL